MKTSESINEIAKAISILQGKLNPVQKDGSNPFFKSKYATLNSIWDSLRPLLSELSLAIIQDACPSDKGVGVMTRIIHSSGQWIECGPLEIGVKADAHAIGSATTYAKRYALCALLGVVSDEDDDGNAANNNAPKNPPKPKPDPAYLTDIQIGEINNMLDTPELQAWLDNTLKEKGYDSLAKIEFSKYKGLVDLIVKKKGGK